MGTLSFLSVLLEITEKKKRMEGENVGETFRCMLRVCVEQGLAIQMGKEMGTGERRWKRGAKQVVL